MDLTLPTKRFARNQWTNRGMTREEAFWEKVDTREPDACWLWVGSIVPGTGYGQFYREGKNGPAHRAAWEYHHKCPIPEGLQLDHLCRNRRCVNPHHLEAVTPQVNQHRSDSVSGINARKTHCVHGHSLADAYINCVGRRVCRECTLIKNARRNRRKGG